jgi:PAS domain-containing protein
MIQALGEHLGIISGIIGSLGVMLASWKWVFRVAGAVYRFFSGPSRVERKLDERMKQAKDDEQKRFIQSAEMEAALKKITYALFNGGNEGLVNQVARLSACHSAAFEAAPYPSFECTSEGVNTRVNEAYRILTQVWSAETITAGRWHQVLHGELVNKYNVEFNRCAAAKEDFIGVVDFKNPMTDEHRGRWRIHAPAAQIGTDCLYVGRFIAALDDTARKIAMEEGWSVKMS